jgi:hypothetical protein
MVAYGRVAAVWRCEARHGSVSLSDYRLLQYISPPPNSYRLLDITYRLRQIYTYCYQYIRDRYVFRGIYPRDMNVRMRSSSTLWTYSTWRPLWQQTEAWRGIAWVIEIDVRIVFHFASARLFDDNRCLSRSSQRHNHFLHAVWADSLFCSNRDAHFRFARVFPMNRWV